MQAFRMFFSAEESHKHITAYLEKAKDTPTGKLWVDSFITPTL